MENSEDIKQIVDNRGNDLTDSITKNVGFNPSSNVKYFIVEFNDLLTIQSINILEGSNTKEFKITLINEQNDEEVLVSIYNKKFIFKD
jgi:hypothetical protein